MFIGEYEHTVDAKGRMAIPAKFRKDLKRGAVVTRGIDNSLFLYTLDEWKELATKLARLPISQKNSRAFARLMLAGAMDVTIDSQGRINVPDYLRSYARITKQVVVVGLYSRLEIWDKKLWSTYKQQTEAASEDIAEKMSELGI
jgi:MraZ protein